uniref:Uncharacterized protein n=1 Tax=Taeniopygia guttata TaxID=59729 RepID=A0A674H139_TAEGU
MQTSHENVPDLSLHRLGSLLGYKALTSKLDRFSISSEGTMSYKLLCWDPAHAVTSHFNNLNDLARTSAPGIVSSWRALGLRWDGNDGCGRLRADAGRVLGHRHEINSRAVCFHEQCQPRGRCLGGRCWVRSWQQWHSRLSCRAGQGMAWHGRAWQGRAGQGRAGQGSLGSSLVPPGPFGATDPRLPQPPAGITLRAVGFVCPQSGLWRASLHPLPPPGSSPPPACPASPGMSGELLPFRRAAHTVGMGWVKSRRWRALTAQVWLSSPLPVA